jgi:glutamyl-tRNA synthetase
LRVALTGRTAAPGIFEVVLALGKEKTLERIGRLLDLI